MTLSVTNARVNVRSALGQADTDLEKALASVSLAQEFVRDDARLSVLEGLTQNLEEANSAMSATIRGRGSQVKRAKARLTVALLLLDQERERQRQATVVLDDREYRDQVQRRSADGVIHARLVPLSYSVEAPGPVSPVTRPASQPASEERRQELESAAHRRRRADDGLGWGEPTVRREESSHSVRAFSGGLPTLGKRR